MLTIHGIRNCDSMARARAWLDAAGVEYRFHDWRRDGVDPALLGRWAAAHGWEALLNTRGTTFRGLDPAARADLDGPRAVALMVAAPAMIRRPILSGPGVFVIGFDPARHAASVGMP